MKKLIPSLITLANLACGCVALIMLFKPPTASRATNAWIIAGLMSFALACDFADGLVARLLGVSSEIGKQLDSFADMVTFGVLPGMLVYFTLKNQAVSPDLIRDYLPSSWVDFPPAYYNYLPWLGLLIPVFSAWRLAKFNVDTRQTDHFRGLATPTNAFFFLSIFMMQSMDTVSNPSAGLWGLNRTYEVLGLVDLEPTWFSFFYYPPLLSGLTIGFCILMVINIPLIAFKMEDYSFRKNALRYLLLGISLILLLVFQYKAVPMIMALYFILSFIDRSLKKR